MYIVRLPCVRPSHRLCSLTAALTSGRRRISSGARTPTWPASARTSDHSRGSASGVSATPCSSSGGVRRLETTPLPRANATSTATIPTLTAAAPLPAVAAR